jgi:hypothetical protein
LLIYGDGLSILEAERSRDRGAKHLPGIAERQLGILNPSAFPDAELALGDPRAPARPIAFGNFQGSPFLLRILRHSVQTTVTAKTGIVCWG